MAGSQHKIVVLPPIVGHVHIDTEDVGRLDHAIRRGQLRMLLDMVMVRIARRAIVGCLGSTAVKYWKRKVVDVAQIEVDKVRKVLLADSGHVAVLLLRLRPVLANGLIHRIGLGPPLPAEGLRPGKAGSEGREDFACANGEGEESSRRAKGGGASTDRNRTDSRALRGVSLAWNRHN